MNEGTSRLRKDQRRELIKEAALTKMVEEGVESISMRAIAKAAEISETLLYRFFRNKYAILHDIFSNEIVNIAERVEEMFETTKVMITDVEKAIPTLVKIIKKLLNDHKLIIMLYINEEENINSYIDKGKPLIRKKGEEKTGDKIAVEYFLNPRTVGVIVDYFKRAQDDGYVRKELDPKICAMMLATIIWQTVVKTPYKLFTQELDDDYYERLLDEQIQIMINGFKPPK